MYFLLGVNDVPSIINRAIRALCALLCELFYPLIAIFYEVFRKMGLLFYNDTFDSIYKRISLVLGIYMVFRISFWLIELLVNPDKVTDKEKNPSKIITRTLIVVVMLAITPSIFKYSFRLQYEIIDNSVIEKLIVFNDSNVSDNMGRYLAANLFDNFYDLNSSETNEKCINADKNDEKSYTNILLTSGELNISSQCLTATTKEYNPTYGDNEKTYVLSFNGFCAALVGGVVAWMLLMYCISVGTRYVQLIFLQVIAPIPIMCYVSPSKDNMFEKWIKQCLVTYIDLFIRVAIISFAIMLCQVVFSSELLNIPDFSGSWIIEIFIVLGLLTFAKKAPDLIQELLPKGVTKASGDFGLSWKKRTDAMLGGKYVYSAPKKAVGFGIASLDTLRRTGVRAYNAYKYNKREDDKLEKYRQRRIDDYKKALDIVKNNSELDPTKRSAGIQAIQSRIAMLEKAGTSKSARAKLRKGLINENKGIANALENPVRTLTAEERAKIMTKYTQNVESGTGHRNQASTFATSLGGGMLNAANSTLHNSKVRDIISKAAQSTTKSIDAEQKWYANNDYTTKNVMQRIVSEVQRKYGIETKGQAIQYSIDALNADIKFEEEQLSKVKESQKAYSSVVGEIDNMEKKGEGDRDKAKPIILNDGKVLTLKSDIQSMDDEHARMLEYYKKFSVEESGKSIVDEPSHERYLRNFIHTVSAKTGVKEDDLLVNVGLKKKIGKDQYAELSTEEKSNMNLSDVYNSVLTKTRETINKNNADRGKLLSAAAVGTYLIKKNDPDYKGGYYSIDIKNYWDSLVRTIHAPENSNKFNQPIIYNENETTVLKLVEDAENLFNVPSDMTEDNISKLQKMISAIKDEVKEVGGNENQAVASAERKINDMKHEVAAFQQYSKNADAINNDKFNSGK